MYNPYQKYKEQSITTLTPAELIIKLFDEAIRQVKLAVMNINEKNLEESNKNIQKTEDIITALKLNLDEKYPIAEDLGKMYDCIYDCLVDANIKKDVDALNKICDIIVDFRETFQQANKLAKS